MPPISNLHLASSVPVKDALRRLKSNYGALNSWIPLANKYLSNTIFNVDTDLIGGAVNHQDMVDYVASSAIIHCFNSWSYLTTSINSYIEGDYSTAVHNAYYSELRSLMSFLATRGIGVFDKNHVIIDSTGTVQRANAGNGTHVFAKNAFDQWISDPTNANHLLQSVSISNYYLLNWLTAAGFTSELSAYTASDLLKKWSIDINLIKGEHVFRNFVSYRPQNFNFGISRHSDNFLKRLETVMGIWEMCEPARFFELTILRKALDDLNIAQTTRPYSDEGEAKIKKLVEDMGLSPDTTHKYIVDFLKRRIKSHDNILLSHASIPVSNPIIEQDTDPIGILSRACLLLLTITNVVENLIKASGTTKAELDFWHDSLGVKSGYWERGNTPTLFADLWTEIGDDITAINSWIGRQHTSPSIYSFKNTMQQYSSNIRQVSKSFFWQTHQA